MAPIWSDPIQLALWSALALASASVLGLLILQFSLIRSFSTAPVLAALSDPPAHAETPLWPDTSLSVVVPAFNEAANIAACLESILRSEQPCSTWQVLVVDDASSDDTGALAQATASSLGVGAQRFRLIQAGERPIDQRWVGKNWPCTCAAEQLQSEWLLFVDADVRLEPDALRRALSQAIREEADLFTLAPRLRCSCLAEWMVQPIMASLLGLGFPIAATNDPADPTAFAAGPFMLFRRRAYAQIGGHRAVAGEVVEDLALAQRIKRAGYRLRYRLALDALSLQMYANLPALWEGWTKNWFLGLESNVAKALTASAAVVVMFSVPWLLLPPALAFSWALPAQPLGLLVLLLCLAGIAQQALLRWWSRRMFQVPMHLWWLMGAGGLLVGAIGPTSVWRSLTGQGWTWKGRSLR